LGLDNYLFLFSLFIIKKLRWDKNEKDFIHFLNLLPREGIVLDIGANIGVMSYYLARDRNKGRYLLLNRFRSTSGTLNESKGNIR
jgi:hypothetical protein